MVLTRGGARAARTKEKEGPFRILDLPPELVQAVFHLFIEDYEYTLLDVRLVCRTFRDHSISAFGTSFFERVCAMLHPLSLTTLLEIANHPELSKFVREVIISGEQIGGIIDLSGHQEEQKLKSLQTSMERSRLDRMILTDVFRKLPSMSVVRIDNGSYCCERDVRDAARCGFGFISGGHMGFDAVSPQRGSNRAFEVVFACLRNSKLAGKVDFQVEAHVQNMASQNSNLFDPTSADWKQHFAANVQLLELSGELDSSWALDLMQSVSSLHTLEVFIADNMFQLLHPDKGLFIWPNLRRLKLDHVNCHAQTIIDFFDAHRNSLSDIHLQLFDFVSGSWRMPFQILLGMPKLDRIFFNVLSETTVPSDSGLSFERFAAFNGWVSTHFDLHNNTKIRVALSAVLHDFRTTDQKRSTGYNNLLMFRVDFRLAHAILDGKATISGGECHLLE
jgi:hypothetical protein